MLNFKIIDRILKKITNMLKKLLNKKFNCISIYIISCFFVFF